MSGSGMGIFAIGLCCGAIPDVAFLFGISCGLCATLGKSPMGVSGHNLQQL